MLFIRAVCCRYFLPVSSFVIYPPDFWAANLGSGCGNKVPCPGDLNSSCLFLTVLEVGPATIRLWQLWSAVRTLLLACRPAWAMSSRGLSSARVLGECGRAPAPSSAPMRSLIPPGAPPGGLRNPDRLLGPHLQVPLLWEAGLQYANFEGTEMVSSQHRVNLKTFCNVVRFTRLVFCCIRVLSRL